MGPGIGLTPAQIAATVADCLWLIYLLQAWLPATRNWSITGTNALTEAQSGDGSALMVLPVFVAPALPDGVAPVNTGALNRIFALVQDIKNGGKCSDKDAADPGHRRQRSSPRRITPPSSRSSPSASSADRWSSNGAWAATPPFWTPSNSRWTATTARALSS